MSYSRSKRRRYYQHYSALANELFSSSDTGNFTAVISADQHVTEVNKNENIEKQPSSPTTASPKTIDFEHDEIEHSVTGDEVFTVTSDTHASTSNTTLESELVDFYHKHTPTRDMMNDLLHILHKHHPSLPLDSRTLLNTERNVSYTTSMGGIYKYFGIEHQIKEFIDLSKFDSSHPLKLKVNVDGCELFRSSNKHLWPILFTVNDSNPLVLALFYGRGKPDCVHTYMKDFIDEYERLSSVGLQFSDKIYSVVISAFICDAPARAFLKSTSGHNSFDGCERCCIKGHRVERRTVFDDFRTDIPLRTDEDFARFKYNGHQTALSPLHEHRCISKFVLDYMHLVCLGVVKKIISFWKNTPLKVSKSRLSPSNLKAISDRLTNLHGKFPSCFARQPRGLNESDRWKATEFREFLIYSGIVVLHDLIPEDIYHHFLVLTVAISILLDDDDDFRNAHLDYAKQLLQCFVRYSKDFYGPCFLSYNVHSLVHIADDCYTHSCSLNEISAFPFESFMKNLKRSVRNSTNPVTSISKNLKAINTNQRDQRSISKLSVQTRNSVVLLKDKRMGIIVDYPNDSNIFTLNIIPRELLSDIFDVPCKSSALSIYKIKSSYLTTLSPHTILKSLIARQCVFVPMPSGDEMALIPLRHCL